MHSSAVKKIKICFYIFFSFFFMCTKVVPQVWSFGTYNLYKIQLIDTGEKFQVQRSDLTLTDLHNEFELSWSQDLSDVPIEIVEFKREEVDRERNQTEDEEDLLKEIKTEEQDPLWDVLYDDETACEEIEYEEDTDDTVNGRFAKLTSKEVDDIAANSVSNNTKTKQKWAVNILRGIQCKKTITLTC